MNNVEVMPVRIKIILLVVCGVALWVSGFAEVDARSSSINSKVVALTPEDNANTQTLLCSGNQRSNEACVSFVVGFLQGALLTDGAIIKSFENESDNLTNRAIRTRLSGRYQPVTERAGFCLPNDVGLPTAARKVLSAVDANDAGRPTDAEFAERVYSGLKAIYPCK